MTSVVFIPGLFNCFLIEFLQVAISFMIWKPSFSNPTVTFKQKKSQIFFFFPLVMIINQEKNIPNYSGK